MSLRQPLLSRWIASPTQFLQSASALKSSPYMSQSLFMRLRPMGLSGSPSLPSTSLSRSFSLGRSFQLQGRSLGRMNGRPRIENTRPRQQRRRQQQQRRGFSSSRQAPESLSQKLRKLSLRLLGADRIGHYEDVILQTVADGVHAVWPSNQDEESDSEEAGEENRVKAEKTEEQTKQATAKKKADQASLWTQLALAYAIHKSLIFIRVPLTAAITPKVVKVLRAWGVDITRRRP